MSDAFAIHFSERRITYNLFDTFLKFKTAVCLSVCLSLVFVCMDLTLTVYNISVQKNPSC